MTAENNEKITRRQGFKPGKSGNPGGRPPKTEPERRAEELMRKKTYQTAKALLEMAGDPETPPKVRVDIYKYILDRALGKPKVSGELGISGTITHNVFDPDERAQLLESVVKDD